MSSHNSDEMIESHTTTRWMPFPLGNIIPLAISYTRKVVKADNSSAHYISAHIFNNASHDQRPLCRSCKKITNQWIDVFLQSSCFQVVWSVWSGIASKARRTSSYMSNPCMRKWTFRQWKARMLSNTHWEHRMEDLGINFNVKCRTLACEVKTSTQAFSTAFWISNEILGR